MSELLMRVGAAILEAESRWTPKSDEPKERAMARAALEALRNPTHRMTVAGHTALDETEHTQTKALGSLMGRMAFVDVWQAMIDDAISASKA